MSHNQLDTLIHMVNQIAANNGAYESEEAATRVASHLKRFWARSMKKMIIEYLETGGEDLSPIAKMAVTKLPQPAEPSESDSRFVS